MSLLKTFQEEQDKEFQLEFRGDARDGWQDSAVAHIHSREEALEKIVREEERAKAKIGMSVLLGSALEAERKRIGEEVEKVQKQVGYSVMAGKINDDDAVGYNQALDDIKNILQ